MIKFESVYKKYSPSGPAALEDITVEIESGQFSFLIGPSGAGKSTLLKLITREILPTSGKIYLGNEDILRIPNSKVPILRRRIGTVFQDFKLLLTHTVFENVAIPLEVLGKKASEVEKQVNATLEMVGLLSKSKSFPAELSGGEVQRTAIARAISGKPQVLLADEPTGDLDPKTATEIVKLLEKINKEDKTTVVMATHNAQVVNEFKKRVLVLEGGKIVRDDREGKYERS